MRKNLVPTVVNISVTVQRGGRTLVITTDNKDYNIELTLGNAIFGSGAMSKQLLAMTEGEA